MSSKRHDMGASAGVFCYYKTCRNLGLVKPGPAGCLFIRRYSMNGVEGSATVILYCLFSFFPG